MKISKIRKYLEKNKIFFEVIVASLLSFMAIYVSVQANKIAESQTMIMEQENLPQLEIRMTQDYDETIKIYDNNIWLFFNRGGKILNFDIKEYSFFKFNQLMDTQIDSLNLPLYGYLNMRGILTGESDGLIYQIDNDHNGVKEVELRNSLIGYGYFNISTFVKVTYDDIFDKPHVEYFQINPGIKKISEQKWKEAENEFNNSNERFQFSKLERLQIIKMLETDNNR